MRLLVLSWLVVLITFVTELALVWQFEIPRRTCALGAAAKVHVVV